MYYAFKEFEVFGNHLPSRSIATIYNAGLGFSLTTSTIGFPTGLTCQVRMSDCYIADLLSIHS
jgi:hypothetical protein